MRERGDVEASESSSYELTLGQLDSTVSWFLSLTSKIALGAQNTGWPALIVNP